MHDRVIPSTVTIILIGIVTVAGCGNGQGDLEDIGSTHDPGGLNEDVASLEAGGDGPTPGKDAGPDDPGTAGNDSTAIETDAGDVCTPACEGKDCGDDGCGGSCGECGDNEECSQGQCGCMSGSVTCGDSCCDAKSVCLDGECCTPACLGKECGDDGCGGGCGECPEGDICLALGMCCTPNCGNKQCGGDGCGGKCGSCEEGSMCHEGSCCVPDCTEKECGGDGCGDECGYCTGMQICVDGNCMTDPVWAGCSDGTREGYLDTGIYPLIAGCTGAWDIPGIHTEEPSCDRKAGNTGANQPGSGCNVTDLCAEGWHVCLGKMDVLNRSSKGCEEIMDGAPGPAFFLTRTSSTGAFNCAPDAIGDITTVNDIFGCGDMGCPMKQGTCDNGNNCVPGFPCGDCIGEQECEDGSKCTPSVCYPLTRGSHDGCAGLRNDMVNCTYDKEDEKWEGGWCCWCAHLLYWPELDNAWQCGGKGSSEANDAIKTDPYSQGGVLCCKDQCETDEDCGAGYDCIMSTCQEEGE